MLKLKIKYDKETYDNAIAACKTILDGGGFISLEDFKENFGLDIESTNKRYGLESSVGWNKWSFDPHSEVDENKEYLKLTLREPKKLSTLEGYNPGEKLTDKDIKELEGCLSQGEVDSETRFHERYEAKLNKEKMGEDFIKVNRPEQPETIINMPNPMIFKIGKNHFDELMTKALNLVREQRFISVGDFLHLQNFTSIESQRNVGWDTKTFSDFKWIDFPEEGNIRTLYLPEPKEIVRGGDKNGPINMSEVKPNRQNEIDLFEFMLHNMRNGQLPTAGILSEPSDETMEQWKARNFDPIAHPSHYIEGRKYEPRKVISDWGLNFNLGNAVKYIARAGRKGSAVEDLKKAIQYIKFEIEELEEP